LINTFSKLTKNHLNKYFCEDLTITQKHKDMKLFIKNIDKDINEAQLEGLFAQFGEVVSTKIVYDTITWESKGFAFLEMAKKADGQKAIDALNGKTLKGRELIVQEAEERRR
jgi:RNA recognition motif-containing protein